MSERKEIITLPSNCSLMTPAALGGDNGKGPVCFSDSDVKALCLAVAVKRDFICASQRAPGWLLPALFLHLADLTATGAPRSQLSLVGALIARFRRLPKTPKDGRW